MQWLDPLYAVQWQHNGVAGQQAAGAAVYWLGSTKRGFRSSSSYILCVKIVCITHTSHDPRLSSTHKAYEQSAASMDFNETAKARFKGQKRETVAWAACDEGCSSSSYSTCWVTNGALLLWGPQMKQHKLYSTRLLWRLSYLGSYESRALGVLTCWVSNICPMPVWWLGLSKHEPDPWKVDSIRFHKEPLFRISKKEYVQILPQYAAAPSLLLWSYILPMEFCCATAVWEELIIHLSRWWFEVIGSVCWDSQLLVKKEFDVRYERRAPRIAQLGGDHPLELNIINDVYVLDCAVVEPSISFSSFSQFFCSLLPFLLSFFSFFFVY